MTAPSALAPSRRKTWHKLAILLPAAILLILLTGAASFVLWWRLSLPQISGKVKLPGLISAVQVVHDTYGVPHVFAENLKDAWRTAGYLHAQDRFFQMDLQRRVLQGRLSEVIGEHGLTYDRLFRALDLAGAAEASLNSLSGEALAQLQAYADGVNAWLEGHGGSLPIEYSVLGMQPEPWRPQDSLLWGKAMAWKLSGNWRQEAERARLAVKLPPDEVETLFPRPAPDDPVTIEPRLPPRERATLEKHTDLKLLPVWREIDRVLASLLALPTAGGGASNEWVVDGSRSKTGKPLLANDPHLELTIPILWYLMRITTPQITLAGATAPGAPVLMLGQNGYIAWGFTTTDSDTQDLFIETLDPANDKNYLTPAGSAPFTIKTYQIKVKDAAPVTFTARSTRHGPVLSDALSDSRRPIAAPNQTVALAWPGLSRTDTTAEAIMRLNTARNWDEFRNALKLYQAPTQNLVYADIQGHIGFINAGAVPVRKSGDGRYPADGASGAADWSGFIPADDWPQIFDPPEGVIVNANNTVVPPGDPRWLGIDSGPSYRAKRILERLAAQPRHDLDSFASIQMDNQAVHARVLLPYLLTLKGANETERQALDRLKAWNLEAVADKPEPLIFDWWLRKMNTLLIGDRLEALAITSGIYNAAAIENVLRNPKGYCPAEADGQPDCKPIIARAFSETIAELSNRHGSDPARWRWGDEHVATMPNEVLDHVPGFRRFFDYSFGSDGGFYSVNRGGNLGTKNEQYPLARESGAGFRGLYDLANPANSRFIIATGESGHPLSPFYANLLPLWKKGESLRLVASRDELLTKNTGILDFLPAP